MDLRGRKNVGLNFFPTRFYVNPNWSIYHSCGRSRRKRKDTKSRPKNISKKHCHWAASDNDQARSFCFRCVNIQMMKNNWPGAQNYFMRVEKLHISEKLIKEQIDQVEKAINSRATST